MTTVRQRQGSKIHFWFAQLKVLAESERTENKLAK